MVLVLARGFNLFLTYINNHCKKAIETMTIHIQGLPADTTDEVLTKKKQDLQDLIWKLKGIDYSINKFWKTMANALLQYELVLKRDNIKLIMCDDFYQGVFIPEQNKIMLCANTLMRKNDFENAMSRQLIFLYDHTRGKVA